MTKQRSAKRLEALSNILVDGLTYSWFQVEELDADACTATLRVDTGQLDDDYNQVWKTMVVGPDDVARGLRMYAEYMAGTREAFKGEFAYRAKDAVRAGLITDESQFIPAIHNRAGATSYGWQMVKYDRTNGEEGEYDANTADSVIQFATLGYTIFA